MTGRVKIIWKEQHTTRTQIEGQRTQNPRPGKTVLYLELFILGMGPVFQNHCMQKSQLFQNYENFYCATASPRLQRASLHPGKRTGKRGRPALAQNTASPTWHSPELHEVCRQKQTCWKHWRSLLLNGAGFSGLRWRAGMLAASELQAEREDSLFLITKSV